ncbi:uncharacterized protein LOC109526459 isoform X2 [Hippocampus comes]|uniref:uncharacterized protein LOC109526459 isoform X2 n=1 Tax=Hippocampus comes TaxID=109280 RepID=UPI00094F1241|nr:PREDICTED: uncharacterized protein LOC109526459 isoform X2 [Hippocampus comes]
MEVKGQLISAPAPLTFWDRKQKEHMLALQEKSRSLQALLTVRLAELRHVCLQEAELTGTLPSDFPLATGEKLPCVRHRGGTSRQVDRKYRAKEEDSAHVRSTKTLFSGTQRKHNHREQNTQARHGKMTVHRGCHTDDAVRWESNSTLHSTGDDSGVSPVEVYCHNKPRTSFVCIRSENPQNHQSHRSLLQPHALPHSHISSSAACPSESVVLGEAKVCATLRPNDSSDGLLNGASSPEKEQQGGMWLNSFTGSQPANTRPTAGRGRGYSNLLLDYVLSKQWQPPQPITSQQPPGAPPTYQVHMGEQRHVKVTRTKSCGPFLPVPHVQLHSQPHLTPSQLAAAQDAELEDATRSLHKALALEGLRDWFLRNTIGPSRTNQNDEKLKAQFGGALQHRWTTQVVLMRAETRPRGQLPHSVSFHGQSLHGRSVNSSLYLDPAPSRKHVDPSKEVSLEQTSPETLV